MRFPRSRPGSTIVLLLLLLLWLAAPAMPAATLQPKTLAAWEKYARLTEQRINRDLRQESNAPASTAVQITRLQTPDENGGSIHVDGGLIHHWKGSILIPGVTLDRVLRFVQDYNQHYRFFQEVEKSRLVARDGEVFKIFYRLKRTKVITVVYNTDHTITYRRHGPQRASSRGVATRIAELENPGKASETEKPAGNDSGYLWRLNSYWRFEERGGGVLVECESISLSRGIPSGFAWLVRGFVESVPRESLANTLNSLRAGLNKN